MAESDLDVLSATVYDRQIRLWGVDAQRRIADARVVVTGCLDGVAVEIIKNLALAGVGHIALVDDSKVSTADFTCSLVANGCVGLPRAEAAAAMACKLNPHIKITLEIQSMAEMVALNSRNCPIKMAGVVIACNLSGHEMAMLGSYTRLHNAQLFAPRVMGQVGICLVDLICYEPTSRTDSPKSLTEPDRTDYITLEALIRTGKCALVPTRRPRREVQRAKTTLLGALALMRQELAQISSKDEMPEENTEYPNMAAQFERVCRDFGIETDSGNMENSEGLRTFMRGAHITGFLPVCAVLAGFVAQEVIKALQQAPVLANNVALYSAHDLHGSIFHLAV